MFLSGTAFYSARTLLKGRETDLLNLRGLAQVRAVGKQGRRSLCFHNVRIELHFVSSVALVEVLNGVHRTVRRQTVQIQQLTAQINQIQAQLDRP